MKSGTTITDIKKYAKEKEYVFSNGGTWISNDAAFVMFVPLHNTIMLDIAFPKKLDTWDDYKHILVMDDMFGQTYNLFYIYRDALKKRHFLI